MQGDGAQLTPARFPGTLPVMRLRTLALAILVLLAVALVAISVFLNRIIAANRASILAAAEQALGRPIQVAKIEASIWGRPGVRLTGVEIAQDPHFGQGDLLRAESIAVRLALWPLLHGSLEISQIELEKPQIHVVRDSEGQFNLAHLGPKRTSAGPRVPGVMRVSLAAASADSGLDLVVSVFRVDDGTIVFVDRTSSPAGKTTLQHVQLRLADVSRDRPIQYDVRCGVNAPEQNVQLQGSVGPLAQRESVPISLQGEVGPLREQVPHVESLVVQAHWQPDALRIDAASARAFGGDIRVKGDVPLRDQAALRVQAEGEGVEIGEVVRLRSPESADEIEGRAHLVLDLTGKGRRWEELRPSLAGTATIDVSDGALRNFNLMKEVLTRVAQLPGLVNLVSKGLKPKYRAAFDRRDTRFKTLHAALRVRDQRIDTDDLAVVADDFGAHAAGWIGFDNQADMRGTLELSKELSADMGNDVKEAKLFFDAEGRVSVPFIYKGRVGQARPQPDLAKMGPVLGRALGGGLDQLLQRFLGGKGRSGASDQPTPAPKPGSSGDLLQRGLRDLLGR